MSERRANPSLLSVLARAFLAGSPTHPELVERAAHVLGRPWRWLGPLAHRYLARFEAGTRPRQSHVVAFLKEDRGFLQASSRHAKKLRVAEWLTDAPWMLPVSPAETWGVPRIETSGALAAWLELTVGELEWFADLKRLSTRSPAEALRHYRYRVLAKGGGQVRLIEAPKARLKSLQRRILAEILERVPAHAAVHGFLKGKSIRSFVAPHVGHRVVARMDLQDFFPSISGARIQALFRTLGYPESIADLLGGLCTTATPWGAWKVEDVDPQALLAARKLYQLRHLPQGAPTSPALANVCAYRLDCRLAGLARVAGAEYTRYADDLAFSGGAEFEECVERFMIHVAAIANEEGFRVHHRKTRIMRQSVRQQLAGLVTNEKANVRRDDFDRLKATLTNCLRQGAASQNREGLPQWRMHLMGRVAFVESVNPERARRLRGILERIDWES